MKHKIYIDWDGDDTYTVTCTECDYRLVIVDGKRIYLNDGDGSGHLGSIGGWSVEEVEVVKDPMPATFKDALKGID